MDGRLIRWFENQCAGNGLDPQAFDIEAIYATKLTYQENKEKLEKLLNAVTDRGLEEIKELQEKYAHIRAENAKEAEAKEEQEFVDSIQNMDKSKDLSIKPLKDLKFYMSMCLEGYANGFFCKSRGGLGKSFTLHTAISSLGLDENDYHYVTGHLTKTELYKILYENREKTIIFDDVGTIGKKDIISMLKMALWGINGKRFIQYNSPTKILDEYPKMFEFKGRIITLTNDFIKIMDMDAKALISRVHYMELNVTKQELKQMLKEKAIKDGVLSLNEFSELIEYMVSIDDELINVDMRTLDKAYDIYKYSKKCRVDWKDKLEVLFTIDDKIRAFKEAREAHPFDVNAQINEFRKLSGYSRAEYFRVKRRIKSNNRR